MNSQRLNKRLVELGLSPARRKADEAIAEGRVMVNGGPANLGMSVEDSDVISLDGKLGKSKSLIYVAFNKPVGYICSHLAQGNSKTIFELLPKSFAQLKIAGRLDKESEGLVLLSSDGDFVNSITHPKAQKQKEYIVTINKPINSIATTKLKTGVELHDGVSTILSVSKINASTLRVTLCEGKNRQIRRTFEQIGYTVTRLQRVRIGNYQLGLMPSGKHQIIKADEVL